jgi:hypothetical protein
VVTGTVVGVAAACMAYIMVYSVSAGVCVVKNFL